MKKPYIIMASIFFVLFTIVFTVFLLNYKFTTTKTVAKQTYLDAESVQRQEEDIINDKIVCLDEEAIALNGNPISTELRKMAYSAYGQINAIRVQNGLNELIWNDNLEYVANVRAKELPQNFSHTRPNGKPWYTVNSKIQGGENLAYGFETAESVVDAWMNSESHRDNILYPDFKEIAIAIYVVDGTYYWVQEFNY